MGVVDCEIHGLAGLTCVPEAVSEAVMARTIWPAGEVVQIRSEWFGDRYPLPRFWLDRKTSGHLEGQTPRAGQWMGDGREREISFRCLYLTGREGQSRIERWLTELEAFLAHYLETIS